MRDRAKAASTKALLTAESAPLPSVTPDSRSVPVPSAQVSEVDRAPTLRQTLFPHLMTLYGLCLSTDRTLQEDRPRLSLENLAKAAVLNK